jgi:5-methylcytosine-specific restriction endonuclease McrA
MRWFRSRSHTTVVQAPRLSRREIVWNKTGGYCWYCDVALEWETFHVEHQDPRVLGGSNDLDNLVPSCPSCNYSKGKNPLEEHRRREIERGNLPPSRLWVLPRPGKPKFPGERRKNR